MTPNNNIIDSTIASPTEQLPDIFDMQNLQIADTVPEKDCDCDCDCVEGD